jgi:hypothetical protein
MVQDSGLNHISFSDAEAAENEIQDVVRGGRAGDFIEWTQRVIEIEQQHLVRCKVGYGSRGRVQCAERLGH